MTDPSDRVLTFAHIGDLHITDPGQPNFLDLMSILAQLETQARDQLDFVVLPGDCADNGLEAQYALIATALRMLSIPVHVIPGDHDMEPGSLANFHAGLGVAPLPRGLRLEGHRCLFLDFCSQGTGGPDFRLGGHQLNWLEAQLEAAREAAETPVLFMHSYPADLHHDGEADRLTRLLSTYRVALVDMGHTHYNELGNDGTTIFAATRSTGQIEEGPVGYSVATVDEGIVSWRFKPLHDPFPFVVITAPADYRLLRGGAPRAGGAHEIRARVLGREPIAEVECQVDDGAWLPLRRAADGRHWTAPFDAKDRLCELTVRARTESGRPGLHTITVAGDGFEPTVREPSGSRGVSIGAWQANGIVGTELGPNRNGRKW